MKRLVAVVAVLVPLAGCVETYLPGAKDGTAVITTAWTLNAPGFSIVLPEGLTGVSARISDRTAQTTQAVAAAQLTSNYGKLNVPLALPLKAGHTYLVEVLLGEKVVGQREFLARNGTADQARSDSVTATYRVTMNRGNSTPGEMQEGSIQALGRIQGKRTALTGTGFLNQTESGMEIKIRISNYAAESEPDRVLSRTLRGSGTWQSSGEVTGSGSIDAFSWELLGTENKADGAGVLRLSEKERTIMRMSGTFDMNGLVVQMENSASETVWSRVDTGEAIWKTGRTYSNATVAGETAREVEDEDEAVAAASEPPTLDEVTEWRGVSPFPLAEGDMFEMRGLGDAAVQFVVGPGEPRTVSGLVVSTVKVEGHAFRGVAGSVVTHVIRDGDYAGLPVSEVASFRYGLETATSRSEIITMS